MSAKPKKGLGRGFDSLIPTDLFDETFDPTAKQDEKVSELRELKLADIVADPDQPRRHFDEDALDELAASIKVHGILQPIVVVAKAGKFEIVAGERRFRAAKKAGLTTVPALVRTLSDQHRLELSLIENIQRRDLNPLETATAYLKLRDQFNMTLDQIGERVGGKSVSAVSNTLRLLRLPEAVKTAIFEGKITEGQARPLVGLDEKVAADLVQKIIKEEWSARRIEQFVVSLKNAAAAATEPDAQNHSLRAYDKTAERLTKRFSAPVHIRANAKGAGKITIAFRDDEELGRIQQLLGEK